MRGSQAAASATLASLANDCEDNQRFAYAKTTVELAAKNNDPSGAWFAAEEFVLRAIKAPKTAEFEDGWREPATHIKDTGQGSYIVTGYVDSENSFGAKLRADFVVNVKRNGDGWLLEKPIQLVQR